MDFLADESIPAPSVEEIRALGNRVDVAAAEEAGGRRAILERAADEGRLLLTSEASYHDEIFEHGAPHPPGVICFQVDWETPRDHAQRLAAILSADNLALEFDGFFTLVERDRLRQRAL